MINAWIEWFSENAGEALTSVRRKLTFGKKQQANLLKSIAKPMSVGRPPRRIAAFLSEYGTKNQQQIANNIADTLREGRFLSEAFVGWYDNTTVSALKSAETVGMDSLTNAMIQLSDNIEEKGSATRSVFTRWAYPGFYVVMSIVGIILLDHKLMPIFQSIPGMENNETLKNAEQWAHFYAVYLIPLILATIGLVLYCRHWLRNKTGEIREEFDKIKWFSAYRLGVGSNIVSAYALFKKFGMEGKQIYEILSKEGSVYQRYHIWLMEQGLNQGVNELEAMDTGLFDKEQIALLKLYGESDDEHLIEAMEEATFEINTRILEKLKKAGAVVYYALWLWLVMNMITIVSVVMGVRPTQ